MLELWSVHASEEACDLAMRAPGAGRVASDEVIVRGGPIAEDIVAAVRTVDPHAIVRECTEGWAEVAFGRDDARDVVARLSDLRLPAGRGYAQGDVARVAARVFVEDDALHVLVRAPWEAYLRRCVAEAGTDA